MKNNLLKISGIMFTTVGFSILIYVLMTYFINTKFISELISNKIKVSGSDSATSISDYLKLFEELRPKFNIGLMIISLLFVFVGLTLSIVIIRFKNENEKYVDKQLKSK